MRTTTTTKLGKSVADGLAEAAYGPLRIVSHRRTVGVLLSPRDALSLGVICKHGEGPEECSICGPAGRGKVRLRGRLAAVAMGHPPRDVDVLAGRTIDAKLTRELTRAEGTAKLDAEYFDEEFS